ncbi:tRNA pseudouridine(38-40) synthase TruA [Snodgrassella communis]|uniref:tRNA pseudouridine(38-40) synthase TruA n=1 Tax=Snodgrassella communis TaxID=2946699 RepID=UPI00286B2566|nr:tRNA pseudouridine(38-40) synthase TruA [Snodgrassella communis]WMY92391.1 tRNA pseudouridine(38-40) synthase TruA [Snodgrassella communis]
MAANVVEHSANQADGNRPVQRWALTLAYDGGAFHGWQKQPDGLYTIQSVLEAALSAIAAEPINVVVAGRTDAGVHATGQIVHFDTHAPRSAEAWLRGTNTAMDKNIRIVKAQPVAAEFHARFDAYGRRYRYMLESSRIRMPQLRGRIGWTHYPLNMALMREAAAMLIGEHDFSSFRSSDCQAKSPVKTLYGLSLAGSPELMAIDFHGSAFVHNMVRNIVGALVYVGAGKLSVAGFAQLVAAKSRRLAPPTFMPDGLYLTGVDYPPQWGVAPATLPVWLWPHLN